MSQILIIEDQAEVRANIRDILTLEGFDTLTAANGEVGFELACQHHPDLILCDVMMPVVSGYQVVKHLRERDATVDIPFIFLTAKATRDDQRRAMEMGADDYITKPFTPRSWCRRCDRASSVRPSRAIFITSRSSSSPKPLPTTFPKKFKLPCATSSKWRGC